MFQQEKNMCSIQTINDSIFFFSTLFVFVNLIDNELKSDEKLSCENWHRETLFNKYKVYSFILSLHCVLCFP